MFRGMRDRLIRDEGMTIIEVVIAASILFIVLTGVLGLVARSATMGQQATQINEVNNAVSSYVEWVRSLEFKYVEDVGETVEGFEGSLDTTQVVAGPYTITIDPTVEPGNPPNVLRELHLAVTVKSGTFFQRSFDTMVIIRDRDQHLTARRDPLTDPKIVFDDTGSDSPPEGAVVYERGDGASVWLDTSGVEHPIDIKIAANATEGRNLARVELMFMDFYPIKSDIYVGTAALWPDSWSDFTQPFRWDIGAKAGDNTTLEISEGACFVVARAVDDVGADGETSRQFYVDSFAPVGTPGVPVHNPGGSMGGVLSWAPLLDGAAPVYKYELEYRVQGLTNISTNYWIDWTIYDPYKDESPSAAGPDLPFSRAIARVRGFTPRYEIDPVGHAQFASEFVAMTKPFVTRPTVAGSTYTVATAGGKVTTNLTCTQPQFPTVAGTVKYTFQYLKNGTWTDLNSTPQTSNTYKDSSINATREYRAVVTFRPNGESVDSTINSDSFTTDRTAAGTFSVTETKW